MLRSETGPERTLRGPRRDRAQPDRASTVPPLTAGFYALHYKVLAADGHVTESVLRFQVDAAALSRVQGFADFSDSILGGAILVALSIALGGVAFALLVVPRRAAASRRRARAAAPTLIAAERRDRSAAASSPPSA